MKELLKNLYLMWWCDFITIEGFNNYINNKKLYSDDWVSIEKTERIINIGRKIYSNKLRNF